MIGYVRSAETGEPVSHARVTFLWSDFTLDRTTMHLTVFQRGGYVYTDSSGAYRACDLPSGQRMSVQAGMDDARTTGVIDVAIGASGLLQLPLRLMTEMPSGGRGHSPFGGSWERRRHPREAADVLVVGGGQATTGDAEGRFRLTGLFPGTMGLQVQAIGFAPVRIRLDVDSNTPTIAVNLTATAVMLDSVRVYARRVGLPARLREFDNRAHHGIDGVLFTPEDIDRLAPWDVMDLISRVSTYKVEGNGVDKHVEFRMPGAAMPVMGVPCPTIYVNGVQQTTQWGINLMSIHDIYGVEVYRPNDSGPPEYPNLCGEILIWTK